MEKIPKILTLPYIIHFRNASTNEVRDEAQIGRWGGKFRHPGLVGPWSWRANPNRSGNERSMAKDDWRPVSLKDLATFHRTKERASHFVPNSQIRFHIPFFDFHSPHISKAQAAKPRLCDSPAATDLKSLRFPLWPYHFCTFS
jgi:hypothetical protein